MAGGAQADAVVVRADGVRLRIRLVPKSSRDAVEGLEPTPEGMALKARVRAVPEDGKANAAAEKLIAGWLDVARTSVDVVAGHKSRIKTLHIAGEPKVLAEEISRRIGGGKAADLAAHGAAGPGAARQSVTKRDMRSRE